MTPSGIEPATIRFVAQHLKHCATAYWNNETTTTPSDAATTTEMPEKWL